MLTPRSATPGHMLKSLHTSQILHHSFSHSLQFIISKRNRPRIADTTPVKIYHDEFISLRNYEIAYVVITVLPRNHLSFQVVYV